MRWIYGNNKTYSDKKCSKKITTTDFNEKKVIIFYSLYFYYYIIFLFPYFTCLFINCCNIIDNFYHLLLLRKMSNKTEIFITILRC